MVEDRRMRLVSVGALTVCLSAVASGWAASAWRVPKATARVTLRGVAAGSGPAVFFVALKRVGAALGKPVDARSLRLHGPDGEAVPFSLDYRYADRKDLPLPNPRYSDPTGYWGYKYPVAEDKLRRLGYLSFRPVAGAGDYALYFTTSRSRDALKPRPQLAVRPWWIEQIRDPNFSKVGRRKGHPEFYIGWRHKGWRHVKRKSPEGERCYEVFRPTGGRLISQAALLNLDRRIAGRRIILYHVLYAEKGLTGRAVYLSLPSALRAPPRGAIYVRLRGVPPRTWYALSVEGRVSERFEKFTKRIYANYNEPCFLAAFHLQFPPDRESANLLDIGSDLAYPHDHIPLTWRSAKREYLYPLDLTVETKGGKTFRVPARRAEAWPEGFRIEASLTSHDGARRHGVVHATTPPGCVWKGFLPLRNVKPGRYTARLTVRSRREPPETVARIEREVRVIESPFPAQDGERR